MAAYLDGNLNVELQVKMLKQLIISLLLGILISHNAISVLFESLAMLVVN